MILIRPGNKQKIATKLHYSFMPHYARLEPFWGAGGAWFNMPKPALSFLGDADDDVVNLYLVLVSRKEELVKAIELMPISDALLDHWLLHKESCPVQKAVRFLLLSNFTYMGKANKMVFNGGHTKRHLISRIEPTFKQLTASSVRFLSGDFRSFLSKISFSERVLSRKKCFLYLDPPYLGRTNTYNTDKWKDADSLDCLDMLKNSGMNAAMSEFNNPFIVNAAKSKGLLVHEIVSRKNMKNRDTEILITNYTLPNKLF